MRLRPLGFNGCETSEDVADSKVAVCAQDDKLQPRRQSRCRWSETSRILKSSFTLQMQCSATNSVAANNSAFSQAFVSLSFFVGVSIRRQPPRKQKQTTPTKADKRQLPRKQKTDNPHVSRKQTSPTEAENRQPRRKQKTDNSSIHHQL